MEAPSNGHLRLFPRPIVWIQQCIQCVTGGHVPPANCIRAILTGKEAQHLQLILWNPIGVDLKRPKRILVSI